MSRPGFAFPAALLITAILCAQQVRADEEAVTLARAVKVGDTVNYKLTVDFSVNGMDGTLNQSARTVVKEVRKNGDIVTTETSEGGHVSMAGQEQDIPAGGPVTEVRTARGLLVERKTDESAPSPFSPEVQRLMALTSEVILPDKPAKPGDTWTTELDSPIAKDKKVTVKTTFVALDKVDGQDCWKITQVCEADNGAGGKVSFDTTYWLNPSNGQGVKAEGTTKDLPVQFGLMSYKMKMAAVTPSEPAKPETDPGKASK